MTSPTNSSEAFVNRLCTETFLSLWTYANPRRADGRELCDALVVCDPTIVIISVKDRVITTSGDELTDWTRWHKDAIESSAKQLYGAERELRRMARVIRADGAPRIALPNATHRRVLRVAVAFGSQGRAPLYMGDFGRGFVHVFDEESLTTIMGELDTVTDFVGYLQAKEALFDQGTEMIVAGAEEDLLAVYLVNDHSFPPAAPAQLVRPGLWAALTSEPTYLAEKEDDQPSYAWDRLLDKLARSIHDGHMELGNDLDENELAIRAMAREPRRTRRILGPAFEDFLRRSHEVASRLVRSPSGVVYVFSAQPHSMPRKYRYADLANRCFVARGLAREASTVIGVATERYEQGKGHSFDIVHLYLPEWTEEHERRKAAMQRELGYFVRTER